MKRKTFFIAIVVALLIGMIVLNYTTTQAQSGGGYDLTWNTFDGGGGMFSTGGAYSLGGTIGQADAGAMSGGTYALNGGFWQDFLGNKINLPLILR